MSSVLKCILMLYSGCNILMSVYRDKEDGLNLVTSGGKLQYLVIKKLARFSYFFTCTDYYCLSIIDQNE